MAELPVLGAAAEDRKPEGCSLTLRVRMDRAGRLVVPARIRKALGLEAGQDLIASLEGDFVRLQTLDAALRRVRSIARRRCKENGSVVDAFIAERRAEAAKDRDEPVDS